MNKYKIKGTILLTFIDQCGRDTEDVFIGAGDDNWLEADNSTIWYINPNGRHESITTANAIDLWLERKLIEKIT